MRLSKSGVQTFFAEHTPNDKQDLATKALGQTFYACNDRILDVEQVQFLGRAVQDEDRSFVCDFVEEYYFLTDEKDLFKVRSTNCVVPFSSAFWDRYNEGRVPRWWLFVWTVTPLVFALPFYLLLQYADPSVEDVKQVDSPEALPSTLGGAPPNSAIEDSGTTLFSHETMTIYFEDRTEQYCVVAENDTHRYCSRGELLQHLRDENYTDAVIRDVIRAIRNTVDANNRPSG